jgi:L,D-peptidoglycan transpeptidase YkuD (ErfK/YbiS/YcfS/YnhG family)
MNALMSRKVTKLKVLRVRPHPTNRVRGILVAGSVSYPCVVGRSGIVMAKREGDGGTPRGRLALRCLIQRPDKARRVQSLLPHRATRRDDAWCDDPADRRYNRLIRRAAGRAEESLWRSDGLYDVVVPLGWNDGPTIKGRGSAIFWHAWRGREAPTAGCVAVTPDVFRKVLPRLSRRAVMVIG